MHLHTGSRGPKVVAAQSLLNARGAKPRLRQDGVFGRRTDQAIRVFQGHRHLKIDGVIGAHTWAALTSAHHGPAHRPHASAAKPAPVMAGRPAPSIAARSAPVIAAPRPAVVLPPPPVVLPPVLSTPANMLAPWLDVARGEMGVSELPGARHNARILEYHAATTLGARTDEVPWCASFVNWVLREAGYIGSRSAAAASFLDWGTTLTTGREGAIIVIRHTTSGNRGSTGSSSGNHVGFLLSESASHLSILGGNQSDQVKVSSFNKSSFAVRGYRWPSVRGG